MKKLTASFISARLTKSVMRVLGTGDVTLIAVTGSIGKTSARVAIAKLLSQKYRLTYAEHSYNVPVAIELSFFGLEVPSPVYNAVAWQKIFHKVKELSKNFPYDVVVIEINEDDLDELQEFAEKLHPKIAVITGVAPAHMEKLKTMKRVQDQTLSLARYADEIVYNADFAELAELGKKQQASSYGLKSKPDVQITDLSRDSQGFLRGNLVVDSQKQPLKTQMVAQQSLYSLLAAATVGVKLGMSLSEIAKGLASIKPVRGRMNFLPAAKDAKLIDDTYNSSPLAAIAALKTLSEMPAHHRIAVLGSMNELGDYAKKGHEDVGKAAAKSADMLVTVGKTAAEFLAPAAQAAGLNQKNIHSFDSPYKAGEFVKSQLHSDDVVLVKGSQNGVFTEEVSSLLLATRLKPERVLVRQSSAWKHKKKKAFGV